MGHFFGSVCNTDVYLFAKNQSQSVKEILATKEYSDLIGQEHSQACFGTNASNSLCSFYSCLSTFKKSKLHVIPFKRYQWLKNT